MKKTNKNEAHLSRAFKPHQYQSKIENLKIRSLDSIPKDSCMDVDVLFVGGGPAGLSGAIHLKKLCMKEFPDIQIGVIEKANRIGGHCLSGAVINPIALKKLFPDLKETEFPFREKVKKEKLFYLTANGQYSLPPPPTMRNKNFYTISLCEMMRWMAKKAEAMDISIFPAFTAHELLVDSKNSVKGVSTFPAGLNKEGKPLESYQEPVFIRAPLTILADGSRGHLSQTWMEWKNISSKYPQTYALGVKEIWEVPSLSKIKQEIWHTMGWPLSIQCFGGSWMYPLEENLLSLGLVAGLDSPLKNLDVHAKLQELKNHPLFSALLKGGKCVEWGAKTIPEGGYQAMPNQLQGDGVLMAGDSAGMVNVPALKGIHYAMTAGMLSAETALIALRSKDFSSNTLKIYQQKVKKESCIGKELYPVRNVRQAFDKNIFLGLIKSGLMFLTKGLFPGDVKKELIPDTNKERHLKEIYNLSDKKYAIKPLSKTEAVYLSGNKTRDDIPPHLKAKQNLPEEIQDFYTHLCPAGVYEKQDGKLIINAPNCIDCKATDILGPRWNPKEGGSGPNYNRM